MVLERPGPAANTGRLMQVIRTWVLVIVLLATGTALPAWGQSRPPENAANASANPAVSGDASAEIGGTVLLRAIVAAGANPPGSGASVRANLAALGGGAAQVLFDDGTH